MIKIDLDIIKPFIDGTLKTFRDQCRFDATAKTPYLKGTQTQNPFDIVAIIGMTSPSMKGSISLCFPKKIFLEVMSGMLHETFKEMTRELEDGAAELLNIIYGDAKTYINSIDGQKIDMAIPTVVKGEGISSSYFSKGTVIVVPFTSKVGEFYLEFLTTELSIEKEKSAKPAAPRKIDAMVFQPFVSETINTLKTMCGVDVLPVRAYYKHEGPLPIFDLAGVVGVTGSGIHGSFTLCMEKKFFTNIMSKMLSIEVQEINSEIEDGVAELVNIIFGQAKRILNEAGYSIQMAIPTLIKGQSVTSNYFSKNPVIILPFTSPFGQFWIEFTYE